MVVKLDGVGLGATTGSVIPGEGIKLMLRKETNHAQNIVPLGMSF
jgi:hypothetical protein